MGKRNRKWEEPLSGPCQNRGPSMSESGSENAPVGGPVLVELIPRGLAPTVTDIYPSSEPPPEPFDRVAALAGLQVAFAQLGNDELRVTRMRILGCTYFDIAEELGLDEGEAEMVWKRARKRLGRSLFGDPPPPATHLPAIGVPTVPLVRGDENSVFT